LDQKSLIWQGDETGAHYEVGDVPEDMKEQVAEYRAKLIEAICETDDAMLEKYFAGEEIPVNDLKIALRKAVIGYKLVPIFCGSSLRNKGVQPLLDAIVEYLPSPVDIGEIKGTNPQTDAPESRKLIPEEKFCGLAFFFVGLIPPSLGLDVPHSNRALLALPWAQLTAILGIIGVYECTTRLGRRFQMGIWMIIIGVLCYNVINYVGIYNAVYTSSTALHELGYGYDELMAFVRPKEGGVDHVYFTDSYGQAYIYILFFKRLTPMEYQHGGLANYTISSKPYTEATGKKNVLIVGTAEDFPDSVVPVKEIYYPDGKIAFKVVTQ
jgi:hypothetical protein